MTQTVSSARALKEPLSILIINYSYWAQTLRALGHKVLVARSSKPHFEVSQEDLQYAFGHEASEQSCMGKADHFFPPFISLPELLQRIEPFKPDCIIYIDTSSRFLLLRDLASSAVPTLFYSIDAHIHHNYHRLLAPFFDQVLLAQKDYLEAFAEHHQQLAWFPLWARLPNAPLASKRFDVSFVGSLDPQIAPERQRFLDALLALVPIHIAQGPYLEVFAGSKIVLNHLRYADLNFRVFEAMRSGALLLTPDSANGLHDLFVPAKHLVTYQANNPNDAAEKIRYYLAHDNERERIAQAGYELVSKCHTEEARALELEQHLRRLSLTPRSKRDLAEATEIMLLLELVEKGVQQGQPDSGRCLELLGQWQKALGRFFQLTQAVSGFKIPVDVLCLLLLFRAALKRHQALELGATFAQGLWDSTGDVPFLRFLLIDFLLSASQQQWLAQRLSPAELNLAEQQRDYVAHEIDKEFSPLIPFGIEAQAHSAFQRLLRGSLQLNIPIGK